MNTPFDFMSTPYLYMNACFLKIDGVFFMRGTRKARGIVAARSGVSRKRTKRHNVPRRYERSEPRIARREAAAHLWCALPKRLAQILVQKKRHYPKKVAAFFIYAS